MHVGRTYPFLFEFWQAECFFWPGFVPRKIHVQCPLGYGTSWDRLAGGIFTGVGVPDAFVIGDPAWNYVDPAGEWDLQVLFHKVVASPKEYSVIVRLRELIPLVTSLTRGVVLSPQYSFGGWAFNNTTHFPPFSLGVTVPIQIRAATWSEV